MISWTHTRRSRPRSRKKDRFGGTARCSKETTRRAAKRLALELAEDDASALVSTIPHWRPFADVGPALSRLASDGWKLALLTNCDRDLIAETQRRLPVTVDAVVTAEEVVAYKPGPAHLERFRERFAGSAGRWIHCAQSYFHDIEPAHRLHIPRIWVNRLGDNHDPVLADAVISGLAELPEAVAAVATR